MKRFLFVLALLALLVSIQLHAVHGRALPSSEGREGEGEGKGGAGDKPAAELKPIPSTTSLSAELEMDVSVAGEDDTTMWQVSMTTSATTILADVDTWTGD
ncbi:hypothetical protein V6N13_138926 [Hibiscus sabdariffa]